MGSISGKLLENCQDASRVLKLLSHPERLKLLCLLSSGERTVNDLTDQTELSQSGVSQYLKRMKIEGLVGCERRGHYVFYSIVDAKVMKLVPALEKIFCA